MTIKSFIRPVPLAVVVVSILTAAVIQSLPDDTARALTSETGPFEIGAALGYAIAVALAAIQLVRQPNLLRLSALAILLWALMRELDFQKRFTYRSMESLGYYTRPIAPWPEKLLVLLILAPFLVAGCHLFWLLLKRWRPALARGERWVAYLAAGVILGTVSRVLEKLLHWSAAEEVCEAGLALLVLMLVWELRPRPPQAGEFHASVPF